MKAIRNALLLLAILVTCSVSAQAATNVEYRQCVVTTTSCTNSLRAATLTGDQFVSVAGYYAPGDGGGGNFTSSGSTSCTDNGGTIIKDSSTPQHTCFYRLGEINVLDFGAKCDVVGPPGILKPTFATVPTYDLTATQGAPFASTDQGKNIVIAGAGNVISAYVTTGSRTISFAGASGATTPFGTIPGSKISDASAIPSNTTVSAIGTFAPTGLTGDTSLSGQSTINVSSTAGVTVGMAISGPGIPVGDTVASPPTSTSIPLAAPTTTGGSSTAPITVIGQTITLSNMATVTVTNDTVAVHGAVLATTISTVVTGVRIQLNSSNPQVQDNTNIFYAVKVQAVPTPGSGYVVGNTYTLSDNGASTGTTIQVQQIDGSGGISGSSSVTANGANVYTQVALDPTVVTVPGPTTPVTVQTPSGGTPASLFMSYTGVGVYWFGTDDTVAIQNALNSAPTNSDVWLPENKMCGVTKTIQLPKGNTSLRGWNQTSSGLVALAYMPQDPTNSLDPNTYVVMTQSTPTAGGSGGGMRDLLIEGFQLADYVVGDLSGQHQTFRSVIAKDAMPYTGNAPDPTNPSGAPTTSEWLYGSGSGIQITGIVFDDINGVFDFNQFPLLNELPDYAFTTKKQGTGAVVSNSIFTYARIGIGDEQSDWNLYLGDYVNSILPFPTKYCAEAGGKISIVGLYCDSPNSAAVHIASSSASVVDLFARWGNFVPSSTTFGVLIDGGFDYDYVTDVRTGTFLTSPANVVAMNASVGGGTIGPNTIISGNPGAALVALGVGASNIAMPPQGRLTFVGHTPVMTSNKLNQTTILYTCYAGGSVPYFNGVADAMDAIQNCQTSVVLEATSPGLESAGDLFDVWWYHNGGSPVLCVATNGSGGGWSADSGSLTARGTGYSAIDNATRSYITNANALSHCYNGTTNYSVPANQGTYLGSFLTTAAGKTQFNPIPSPGVGGDQAVIGIWNAYNRVPVNLEVQDTHVAYPAVTAATWEIADAAKSGVKNNIVVVDGLQQNAWDIVLTQPLLNSGAGNPQLYVNVAGLASSYLGSTCAVAAPAASSYATQQQASSLISIPFHLSSLPILGANCAQAEEYASNTTTAYFNPNLILHLGSWMY